MKIIQVEIFQQPAEALLKQGKAGEGVPYINAVRKRAAWPGHEADMEITADELTLDFILDERALELGAKCSAGPTSSAPANSSNG